MSGRVWIKKGLKGVSNKRYQHPTVRMQRRKITPVAATVPPRMFIGGSPPGASWHSKTLEIMRPLIDQLPRSLLPGSGSVLSTGRVATSPVYLLYPQARRPHHKLAAEVGREKKTKKKQMNQQFTGKKGVCKECWIDEWRMKGSPVQMRHRIDSIWGSIIYNGPTHLW